MQVKICLPGITVVTAILLILASGCASSPVAQPLIPWPTIRFPDRATTNDKLYEERRRNVRRINYLRLHPLKPETYAKSAISGCATIMAKSWFIMMPALIGTARE